MEKIVSTIERFDSISSNTGNPYRRNVRIGGMWHYTEALFENDNTAIEGECVTYKPIYETMNKDSIRLISTINWNPKLICELIKQPEPKF